MNYKINQQLICVFSPHYRWILTLFPVKYNGQCDLGNQRKWHRSKQVRSFNDRIVPNAPRGHT